MSRRWFTSDLHLGDEWIAKRRRSPSVANHDDWLATRWDSKVAAQDEVWCLGDMVNGLDPELFRMWLTDRPGTKHLVMGNWEDEVSTDPAFWLDLGYATVRTDFGVIDLAQVGSVSLQHRPRAVRDGELLLHGHTHRPVKITAPGVVHIGWDAWRRLIPEEDVIETLQRSREGTTNG